MCYRVQYMQGRVCIVSSIYKEGCVSVTGFYKRVCVIVTSISKKRCYTVFYKSLLFSLRYKRILTTQTFPCFVARYINSFPLLQDESN